MSHSSQYKATCQDKDEILELMGDKKSAEPTHSANPIALLSSKLLKASGSYSHHTAKFKDITLLTKSLTQQQDYGKCEAKEKVDDHKKPNKKEKTEEEQTRLYEKNIKQKDDLISKYIKEVKELKSQVRISSAKLAEEQEKGKLLNCENLELKSKLSSLEKTLEKEKESFEKERQLLIQKQSGFSNTSLEEKKRLELRCLKLSKQISDFEKVVISEREKFDLERKSFSKKNGDLSLKITDLEKELDVLIKESEKGKVEGFRAKCLKDDFAKERKIFQTEISKLTQRLAGLATEIMKEQMVKSDLQKKLDLILKERNNFPIKGEKLEENNLKGDQPSYASSSSSSNRSSKNFFKSNKFSKDQIRPSNLFYNSRVDKQVNPSFKKVKMEWRVKGTTPDPKSPNSVKSDKNNTDFHAKPFVKTDRVYSISKLISLSAHKLRCSYCKSSDFVNKDHDQYWYGSYSIPGPHRETNRQGSIKGWIPNFL